MQLHSCQNCRWISRSIIGELSLKHSVPHNKQSVPEGVLTFYISLSPIFPSSLSCLSCSHPLPASLPPSPCFALSLSLLRSPSLYSDLCAAYGKVLLVHLPQSHSLNITKMLQEGKSSRTKRTKTLCSWALKEMKALQKW